MLDFVGRKDNQIKHMGYRIELEEIEAALNQIEGVVQSAVLHRPSRREMKMLVAYVAGPAELQETALRESLSALLPPYMIPQRFYVREALPKNANGKVDRIALAAEPME
jgi:D-alanine--poly(phosphoribitol) ligase subunit 1